MSDSEEAMSTGDSIPSISPDIIELVPESVARENCVLAAAFDGEVLSLYCPNEPSFSFHDEERISFILGQKIRFVPIARRVILDAINRNYMVDEHIIGCDLRFRFRCPLTWDLLAPTADESVRHCSICDQPVYFCQTAAEAAALGSARKCIAIFIDSAMTLGLPLD